MFAHVPAIVRQRRKAAGRQTDDANRLARKNYSAREAESAKKEQQNQRDQFRCLFMTPPLLPGENFMT
jgi:hypothetical protein